MADMFTVIGLMSGTSFDGIDIVAVQTDGKSIVKPLHHNTFEYPENTIKKYKEILGLCKKGIPSDMLLYFERDLTILHAEVVNHFIEDKKIDKKKIDFIAFHGQTINHMPSEQVTLQLGNGALLARETGIDVYCDFRSTDIAYGGQGAPILPIYHKALLSKIFNSPFIVLNIGGVANVTYIDEDELIAFDTGPGNAMIDDVVFNNIQKRFDEDGKIAETSTVITHALNALLQDEYFELPYPKSLDRNNWLEKSMKKTGNFSYQDQVATLTEFTVLSIVKGIKMVPKIPKTLIVCGGGRHNKFIINRLKQELKNTQVKIAEEVKLDDGLVLNGSAVEAQGIAYIAARNHLKLPVTYPSTTGVIKPVGGAAFYRSWS